MADGGGSGRVEVGGAGLGRGAVEAADRLAWRCDNGGRFRLRMNGELQRG